MPEPTESGTEKLTSGIASKRRWAALLLYGTLGAILGATVIFLAVDPVLQATLTRNIENSTNWVSPATLEKKLKQQSAALTRRYEGWVSPAELAEKLNEQKAANAVREVEAYDRAVQENTSATYRLFLTEYGESKYRPEIEESLATCRMEERALQTRDVARTLAATRRVFRLREIGRDCERAEIACEGELKAICSGKDGTLGKVTFRREPLPSSEVLKHPWLERVGARCLRVECEAVCEWSEAVNSSTVEICRNPLQVTQDKLGKAHSAEPSDAAAPDKRKAEEVEREGNQRDEAEGFAPAE